MKLHEINYFYKQGTLLSEGYGKVNNFDYHGDQVTDPRPKALSLGKWKSSKGNNLMAGINLNYLSDEQVGRLQKNLQTVLRSRNLQTRARTLRNIMPDIFNTAYRTYNKDAVNNINPETLKFASIAKDIDPSEPPEKQKIPEPQVDPNSSVDKDDVTAPQLHSKPIRDVKPSIKPEEPEEPSQPQNIGTDEVEPEDIDEPELNGSGSESEEPEPEDQET